MPVSEPAETRFWRFVNKTATCWLWTGTMNHRYGYFWDGTKMVIAHRWPWTQANGPVPEGMHLDHLCKNPPCVRLDHLELVTPRENWLRSTARNVANLGRTHCVNGHEYTPENTCLYRRSRQCRTCKRECHERNKDKYNAQRRARAAALRASS